MIARVRPGIVPAAVVLAAVWTAALVAQAPAFRSTTSVVFVDVLVSGPRGPVAGLSAGDFRILEDGVPQKVDGLALDALPLDLTLVLDLSGSTSPVADRFQADARRIAALLGREDRVRLVTFASEVLERVPLGPLRGALAIDTAVPPGGTSLYDALVLVLARGQTPGRRSLTVAFTDGMDTTSVLAADALGRVAGRADTVLYVVLSGNARPVDPARLPPIAALREVAEATGGVLYEAHRFRDATAAFTRVLEDFRQRYVLRYTPSDLTRPGWRDLIVRVARPEADRYTILARRGYVLR